MKNTVSYADDSLSDALAMNPDLEQSLHLLTRDLQEAVRRSNAGQVLAVLAKCEHDQYFRGLISQKRSAADILALCGQRTIQLAAMPTAITMTEAVNLILSRGRNSGTLGVGAGILGLILSVLGTSTLRVSDKIDDRILLGIARDILRALGAEVPTPVRKSLPFR